MEAANVEGKTKAPGGRVLAVQHDAPAAESVLAMSNDDAERLKLAQALAKYCLLAFSVQTSEHPDAVMMRNICYTILRTKGHEARVPASTSPQLTEAIQFRDKLFNDEARERAELERDKLAGDLAKTADWYQRMERVEKALRDAQELIEGALRNGDWERVKRALASLKSSESTK